MPSYTVFKWKLIAIIISVLFALSGLLALPAGAAGITLTTLGILNEIDLSWDAVPDADFYNIYRASGNGTFSILKKLAPVELQYRDEAVDLGRRYSYQIMAGYDDTVIEVSNVSSAIAGGNSKPSAPTLTARIRSNFVELVWCNPDRAIRYEIERKSNNYDFGIFSPEKEFPYKAYTGFYCIDPFVSPNLSYTYRIRAFNDYGYSDYSNEVKVTAKVPGVPNTPSDLSVSHDKTNSQAVLSWQYDDTDITGFRVQKKSYSSDDFKTLMTINTNRSYSENESNLKKMGITMNPPNYTFVDKDVLDNSIYYYRVGAYNAAGNCTYTKEVCLSTSVTKAPDTPTGLKAQADSGVVTLFWQDNARNESSYQVERTTVDSKSFSVIANLSADCTSYTDINTGNEAYSYRVRCRNSIGDSNYSNEVYVNAITPNPRAILYNSLNSTAPVKTVNMSLTPVTREGVVFVPLRDVSLLLGATVKWSTDNKIVIMYDKTVIELWINKNLARINGKYTPVDVHDKRITPIMVKSRYTMLPREFMEHYLKCKIIWSPDSEVMSVYYN
ncbi:MAG: fibronectin type III domain-containing protein [Methylocystaceae bacterium]